MLYRNFRFNLNKILAELVYWIKECSKCLTITVIPLIKLFKELRFHDVVFLDNSVENSIRFIQALVSEFLKNEKDINALIKISFESLDTFSIFLDEMKIFKDNDEFILIFFELLSTVIGQILNYEELLEIKINFIRLFNNLLKKKNTSKDFKQLCMTNHKIYSDIIEIYRKIIDGFNKNIDYDINYILQSLCKFLDDISDIS